MKKLLLGFLLAAVSLPAYAWGEREQGALAGVIIGSMLARNQVYAAPQVYAPPVIQHGHGFHHHHAPMYVPRITTRCFYVPVYDQYGNIAYYNTQCVRERY
jgi:hypothetical protein